MDWPMATMESSGPSTPRWGPMRPKRSEQAMVAAPQTGQCHHLVLVFPRYSHPVQPGRSLPMSQQAGQMKKMVVKAMMPIMSPSVVKSARDFWSLVGSRSESMAPLTPRAMPKPMDMMICQEMKRTMAQRRVHQPFHGVLLRGSSAGSGGGDTRGGM